MDYDYYFQFYQYLLYIFYNYGVNTELKLLHLLDELAIVSLSINISCLTSYCLLLTQLRQLGFSQCLYGISFFLPVFPPSCVLISCLFQMVFCLKCLSCKWHMVYFWPNWQMVSAKRKAGNCQITPDVEFQPIQFCFHNSAMSLNI